MLLVGMKKAESIGQLITVLLIFILVLALTLVTTKWIARYQKGQRGGNNIDIVETCPMGNGKYIQIVKLADAYVAIAVCKDSVTLLAELNKEQIVFPTGDGGTTLNFKELLQKARSLKDKSSKEE
ncbi:MAG TPA: flagellar biosynthetic protein FliO [Lachnospiraceae bacterium]|nr:flagellar biosynthetic protein FliO [Lachnospiraceae bacterium]